MFAQDDIDLSRWLTASVSGRVDVHNQFGTFVSPRGSLFVHGTTWNSRLSVGSGFFAPTPLTEETEAAGLTRLKIDGPLQAERGRSASWDVTRTAGSLTLTGTLFRYDLTHPAVVERSTYTLSSLASDTIINGAEAIAVLRREPFSVTGTYAYVRSLEGVGVERGEVPLTPRHSAGLVAMWERADRGRVGVECYLTGRQRLEDNPYRPRALRICCLEGWSSGGSAGCECSSTRKTSPTCGKPIGTRCSGRSRRPMAAGPLTRGRRSTAVSSTRGVRVTF